MPPRLDLPQPGQQGVPTGALKRWFEEVHSAGIIPVSLIRWQLTGNGEEIRAIVTKE